MFSYVSIGESEAAKLIPHLLRSTILSEVHARPFTAITVPARVLHFAFDTSGARAQIDRTNLDEFYAKRSLQRPDPSEKHRRAIFGTTALRWEQHSEFTTYTWEMPSGPNEIPFSPNAATIASQMQMIPQPGPLLVAIDLHLLAEDGERTAAEKLFDKTSLALAENSDGSAVYATDFQLDPHGFVRILVLDRGMLQERAGALVQRIIEIETYRTLALLGLPEAQRLSPSVGACERRLVEVTSKIQKANDLDSNHRLLDELTALAAEVEAGAAASVFRFGASRAYEEIVTQRLQTIGERKIGGWPTWSSFLARRMKPALRTCVTIEQRQSSLSLKLARAANLLRTRVDVELEQQNQQLLKSMNARTRLQLRLQTTVEGLSVAAITYYVVSLFGYIVKAGHDSRAITIEPSIVTAAFVPIAALAIWWIIGRIRRKHIAGED
ncbi:MAG: DUF3422 domain-containing protein [Afipia sp.]|nr:DUF3422 domain-containing protein [Afipia sp.]